MLRVRVLTAFFLVCVFVYCLSLSSSAWPTLVVFSLFLFLTGAEFISCRWHTIDGFAHTEFPRPPLRREHFGMGATYALAAPMLVFGDRFMTEARGLHMVVVWIAVCTALASAYFYRRELDLEQGTQKLLNYLAGFAYLVLPALLMLKLAELRFPGAPGGIGLYFALSVVLLGDTGAYFVGRAFGKTKLLPRVSPKKTLEGAMGGLVASGIAGGLLTHFFHLPFPMWVAILISLAAGIAGQVGDLAESALKRAANVKDSGYLLPGHGGVLDRIDALLFGAPICYFLFLIYA